MARQGRIYLFGDGECHSNPIHGKDLAHFIVQRLNSNETDIEVGGPDTLTQNQIGKTAFSALGKKGKIVHIPVWIRDLALFLIRWFSGQKTYGPIEFFMTVMTMDMVAPETGSRHLSDFYQQIGTP
jgi:hypothetical protein